MATAGHVSPCGVPPPGALEREGPSKEAFTVYVQFQDVLYLGNCFYPSSKANM